MIPGPEGPSEIFYKTWFPLEIGFSLTAHKAQGQTLKAVILDLSSRSCAQMTYAHVYVALSRVRNKEDVRLLYHNSQKHGYAYLAALKPRPDVMRLLNGFKSGTWKKEDAVL